MVCSVVTQLSPEKGTPIPTQFVAYVYCGQMAEWMNMPLGTEVDLGIGHILLDVVQAVHERGTAAPLFSPMSIVATVAHLTYCRALVSQQIGLTRPMPCYSAYTCHVRSGSDADKSINK